MSGAYLVTGCAGFLGSNLVGAAARRPGTCVIGIDNLSMGRAREHRGVPR